MSAKTLAACSFEPALERTPATDHQALEGFAAEIRFREDLWREYRLEAINAGLSTSQAAEYASAISPKMGLVAGSSGGVPIKRSWFYQSRSCLVKRTITSGLIALTRWEKGKTLGQTARWAEPIFAPSFRPWNVGEKS